MKIKKIVFTAPNKAELLDGDLPELQSDEVLVKTSYTTISAGTERANLVGELNISPNSYPTSNIPVFPRAVGYCSAGIVEAVGNDVKSVKVGDRVVGMWSKHQSYNVFKEKNVVKIEYDNISMREAAASFISTFSLGGLRKCAPEIGESCIVFGLGILGLYAVQIAKAAGLVPVIAIDPIKEKREMALKMGADFAFDPTEDGLADKVKRITGGGANIAIEVTGIGQALNQALDCMARFGRVSLLGCTRSSDFTVDYYRKVHFPGITLVGAHTNARPDLQSRPGNYTDADDMRAILKLLGTGRLDYSSVISELHKPEEAEQVFSRLAFDKNFPVGVQFDWTEC